MNTEKIKITIHIDKTVANQFQITEISENLFTNIGKESPQSRA